MLQIPSHLEKQKEVTITKEDMISFETEIKEKYEGGKIPAPIHLSKDNEDELIEIFQYINEDDWVVSAWRNHYHALLHGFDKQELMDSVVEGRSMATSSDVHKFYSSAIVGGIIPIALGLSMALGKEDSIGTILFSRYNEPGPLLDLQFADTEKAKPLNYHISYYPTPNELVFASSSNAEGDCYDECIDESALFVPFGQFEPVKSGWEACLTIKTVNFPHAECQQVLVKDADANYIFGNGVTHCNLNCVGGVCAGSINSPMQCMMKD